MKETIQVFLLLLADLECKKAPNCIKRATQQQPHLGILIKGIECVTRLAFRELICAMILGAS